MKRRVTDNRINFNGKLVNIGIDVHKMSWRVTAMVEGVVVKAVTIKPSYSVLKKVLFQFKGAQIRVAYEAGPALIPIESGNRVKTDKKDSTKLAHYLENNLLKRVWVLSKEERAHRQLLRTRRQISHHRSNVMRQIKSLLLFHGIHSPYEVVKWLRSINGDEYIVHSLNVLVDLYEYLTQQVNELTEEVMLQDVTRFRSADQLSAFIGVTPSQYSSGERVRMGSITHLGNHRVRTLLVESSWTLIRKDPALYKVYESHCN